MSDTIRTDLTPLNAHRNLGKVSDQQKESSERLSSGYRINRAADDAAGLAITQKMTSQINSLEEAATSAGAKEGGGLISLINGLEQKDASAAAKEEGAKEEDLSAERR